MSERVAMGVDASLRGTALVAVPFDWGLDWGRVQRLQLGLELPKNATEAERIRRLDWICSRAMEFAEAWGVTDVFMEEYAFSRNDAYSHALGELGGNLKRDLIVGMGLPLTVVASNTARALIGKFSARAKKGQPKPLPVKDQVHLALRAAGMPTSWSGDEADALVVANWGLSGIEGADALILREAA